MTALLTVHAMPSGLVALLKLDVDDKEAKELVAYPQMLYRRGHSFPRVQTCDITGKGKYDRKITVIGDGGRPFTNRLNTAEPSLKPIKEIKYLALCAEEPEWNISLHVFGVSEEGVDTHFRLAITGRPRSGEPDDAMPYFGLRIGFDLRSLAVQHGGKVTNLKDVAIFSPDGELIKG